MDMFPQTKSGHSAIMTYFLSCRAMWRRWYFYPNEKRMIIPWIAFDDNNRIIGHFIMRYTGGDNKLLRFGWVIVDNTLRGKGYGKQMLILGLKYAFEILGVERVTIGVFENNQSAYMCYKKVGFIEREIVQGEPWNVIEMEILKTDYNKEK